LISTVTPKIKVEFATTDPNKIPITILSRCQRHDCRRVDVDAIIKHMAYLCENEGRDISTEALTLIAREADGSIRDALSLLDLIITSTSESIGEELVVDILGGLDRQSLFDISAAVFSQDAAKIIEIIGRLYDRGQNMVKMFSALLEHFRNLLVVKLNGSTGSLANVSEYEINAMREQIKNISQVYIHQILNILFKEEYNIRQSSSPKLAVEMVLIRVIQIQPALSIDTLIEKIDLLQKGFTEKLSAGSASPPALPSQVLDSASDDAPEPYQPPDTAPEAMPTPPPDTRRNIRPAARDYPPPADEKSVPDQEVREHLPPDIHEAPSPMNDRSAQIKNEPIEASWKNILTRVANDNPALAACFNDTKLKKNNDNQLEIIFKTNQFNINYANRNKNPSLIQSACSLYFGHDIQVTLSGQLAKGKSGMEQKKEAKTLENETLNHPLVEDAMKIFNGKIVEIKIL
jgi:DNA polymerase-3 subunit gamma/tau